MVGCYKHVVPLALVAAMATLTGHDAVSQPLQAQSTSPTIVCSYDPSTGVPNPLEMRSLITLTEANNSTKVVYQRLGALVPGPVESVITVERTLTFPNMSIDRVRQLLLNHRNYYQELLGLNDPDGFAPVNDTLVCRAEAIPPRPSVRPNVSTEIPDLSQNTPLGNTSRAQLPDLSGDTPNSTINRGSSTPTTFYGTIAGLADGNYRYVSGPADDRFYSEQELRRRGGVLFIFRKTGDQLMGSYQYIDGPSICVTGRVSGNTVTGQAYPDDGMVMDLDEAFVSWGPATFLRIRRTLGDEGERYYGSAALELNDFSKINAGSSLPPRSCE